ncbi:hypothetical protein ABI59_09695 [Acidobacteria bacterium Mor1]|nr:hypothetical protein ABI59_09695 [Acidobacteria bacterium Mor1]
MIRAQNHSSYPRVGDTALEERLRDTHRDFLLGKASAEALAAVQDEMGTVLVADQSRAFIQVVTDGMVRWDGPLSFVSEHLNGVEHGGPMRWFETWLFDRRPVVTGPVARSGGFLLHGYKVAEDVAQTHLKVVLPGAVTFARLADDRHYGDLDALADAVADALAAEVAELAAAGVRWFQLDEPCLCRHAEDADRVIRTASKIFAAAGDEATTILSTYFGDLSALAGRLGELPGTHLGLDWIHDGGEAGEALLDKAPESKGLALGLFDATRTVHEDAADVAARLAPHREKLMKHDVLVGPQAGLELLPKDQAFDKLMQARYLVESLRGDWKWE